MRAKDYFVRAASVCICGCLLAPAGCTKEIWITQYPEFYQPGKIKSIAVMPFRCPAAPRSTGGIIIADGLAAALMSNGTYERVYNRSDLRALLAEHDLKDLFSDNPVSATKALKKVTNAQAVITGSVTTYSATSRDERRSRQVRYGYDREGNPLYRRERYKYTRNEANVAVTASMIRVSDGTTIYALPHPAARRIGIEGSPPRLDVHGCLSIATRDVVRQLLPHFAVVRRKIKVKPKEALRTATGRYDGKWEDTKEFSVRSDMMLVVVDLPTVCDRNRFRLVIVREDSREVLAEQDLVWSGRNSGRGQSYKFNPSEIARRGGGPGEYVVKFYSGEEPVITRDFEIVP